jgi:hypothetical protein
LARQSSGFRTCLFNQFEELGIRHHLADHVTQFEKLHHLHREVGLSSVATFEHVGTALEERELEPALEVVGACVGVGNVLIESIEGSERLGLVRDLADSDPAICNLDLHPRSRERTSSMHLSHLRVIITCWIGMPEAATGSGE